MRICVLCKLNRPIEDFSYKSRSRNTRSSYCKECNRTYQRHHYLVNHSEYRIKRDAYRHVTRDKNRSSLLAHLTSHPCVDCGEQDPRVLEFDHISGEKLESISQLMADSYSWTTISREIEKCEVRCANCHKRRTGSQFGWYKSKQKSA
jgi:protein-arginine kinase activator protein McsA